MNVGDKVVVRHVGVDKVGTVTHLTRTGKVDVEIVANKRGDLRTVRRDSRDVKPYR